jgi:hypothetical protein
MAPTTRASGRAAGLAVLALLLQGSTCHAHYCSGDCERHDEPDEGEEQQTEMLVLLPPFDPFGRFQMGSVPLIVPVRGQFR